MLCAYSFPLSFAIGNNISQYNYISFNQGLLQQSGGDSLSVPEEKLREGENDISTEAGGKGLFINDVTQIWKFFDPFPV